MSQADPGVLVGRVHQIPAAGSASRQGNMCNTSRRRDACYGCHTVNVKNAFTVKSVSVPFS